MKIKSVRIALAFFAGLIALSAWNVDAQDVDYDTLSLGIYGTPGTNDPELMFATREGGTPKFYRLTANPKAFYMKTLESPFPVFSMFHDARASSMTLAQKGIGLGISEPQETMHIYSSDRTDIGFNEARLLIENDKSDTAIRTMFELVNNGPARFEFANSNSGERWAFQTNPSDSFMINRLGSGGNEFSIRKNGMVTMGPAGAMNFIMQPNGNLEISGTLSQLSDRNAKEQFETVDSAEVLKRVIQLPVSTWNYKDDDDSVRHMGPMAQDFRKSFHLGHNETSIATVDTAGVTIAAIQGLNQKLENELDEQAKRVDDLEQRLAELTAQLLQDN